MSRESGRQKAVQRQHPAAAVHQQHQQIIQEQADMLAVYRERDQLRKFRELMLQESRIVVEACAGEPETEEDPNESVFLIAARIVRRYRGKLAPKELDQAVNKLAGKLKK